MELSQYRITTSLADYEASGRQVLRTFTVTAAYPTADEKLPGWTLFKDGEHKIVAMVWDGVAAMVERIGDDAAQPDSVTLYEWRQPTPGAAGAPQVFTVDVPVGGTTGLPPGTTQQMANIGPSQPSQAGMTAGATASVVIP
jgi:hypothetical protein